MHDTFVMYKKCQNLYMRPAEKCKWRKMTEE